MSLVTKQGFEPNHKEFGLHIRSEVARKPSLQIAEKIAAVANHSAPWQPEEIKAKKAPDRRRRLRDSYVARADGNLRVGRNSRAISVVESTVLEASTQEFGTRFQRPSYPLLRAAMLVIHVELPGGANVTAPENVSVSYE